MVAHGSPRAGRGSPAQTSREADRAQDRLGPWACLLGLPKDRLVPHAADRACRPWVSSASRTAPARPASLCPRHAVCVSPVPFSRSHCLSLTAAVLSLCLSVCLSVCTPLPVTLPLSLSVPGPVPPSLSMALSHYQPLYLSVCLVLCSSVPSLCFSVVLFLSSSLSLSPILSVSAH